MPRIGGGGLSSVSEGLAGRHDTMDRQNFTELLAAFRSRRRGSRRARRLGQQGPFGVFSGQVMRRLASIVLLFLLAGLIEPFARGAFGSDSCCCPDGASRCSAPGASCSMQSGCGADREASQVPLTVFSLPATAVPDARVSEAKIESAPAASPDSRRIVVPDPPPRA